MNFLKLYKLNARAIQVYLWLILAAILMAGCVPYRASFDPTTIPAATFTSSLLPDLVPLSASVESVFAIDCTDPTKSLAIRLILENQGPVDAAAFQVTLNGVSKTIQEGLPAGEQFSLMFSGYSEEARIQVDPANQVIESDEQDNYLFARLEQPPLPADCLATPTPAFTTQSPLVTLEGHTAEVLSVAFSPDGGLLASGSIDNTLRLWGVKEPRLIRTMAGHPFPVLKVAFSPFGSSIASGSTDGILRIWQVSNGRLVNSLPGHAGWLLDLSYSPDSKYLATGSDDFTVRVWRIVDYRQVDIIDEGMSAVHKLDYSPDGKQLAWVEQNGSVRAWQVNSKISHLLFQYLASGNGLAYSPDGKYLAAGFADGHLIIWSFDENRIVLDMPAHQQAISDLAFSPDGRWLATASQDQTLKLWQFAPVEPATGQAAQAEVRLIPVYIYAGHQAAVNSLAFSPQGDLLASTSDDRTINLWAIPQQ